MALYKGLNDYELIYLIKDNNEIALNLMFEKYSNFIMIILRSLQIPNYYIEEFFQEGLMILNRVIYIYDESRNKTFNRFFELVLRRDIIHKWKKEYRYQCKLVYYEDSNLIEDFQMAVSPVMYQSFSNFDSSIEKKLFEEVIAGNGSPRYFSQKYQLPIKKVYNLLFKLRKNIKKDFENKK